MGMESVFSPHIINSPGRVFVFGDIHGCLDELKVLLDCISRDLTADDTLVFVGDYIDRGLDSKRVIETMLALKEGKAQCLFLKGNHEAMFLDYMKGPRSIESPYLKYGGKETFESYGGLYSDMLEQPEKLVPAQHMAFLQSLILGARVDNFLIVHAGVKPQLALEQHTEKELLWIRDEFLKSNHELGLTVIHGHTPFEDVNFNLPFRIGIDTGAVYGNMLTCIELRESVILQVNRYGKSAQSRQAKFTLRN